MAARGNVVASITTGGSSVSIIDAAGPSVRETDRRPGGGIAVPGPASLQRLATEWARPTAKAETFFIERIAWFRSWNPVGCQSCSCELGHPSRWASPATYCGVMGATLMSQFTPSDTSFTVRVAIPMP